MVPQPGVATFSSGSISPRRYSLPPMATSLLAAYWHLPQRIRAWSPPAAGMRNSKDFSPPMYPTPASAAKVWIPQRSKIRRKALNSLGKKLFSSW